MVRDYQSIWDNPLEDGDLICGREMGNSHDLQAAGGYQEDNWWYPASCWAHAKENTFNLFDILKKRWQYYTHATLYSRCVKIKIWRIFGQSSTSLNYRINKVSLHMVVITQAFVFCLIYMHSPSGAAKPGISCVYIKQSALTCIITLTTLIYIYIYIYIYVCVHKIWQLFGLWSFTTVCLILVQQWNFCN